MSTYEPPHLHEIRWNDPPPTPAPRLGHGRRFSGHAVARWLKIVLVVAFSEADVATIEEWRVQAHVCRSMIKTYCGNVKMCASDSLDVARLLRAVIEHAGQPWDLYNVLNIVDPRTMKHLLSRAGLTDVDPEGLAPTLSVFLKTQKLVQSPTLLMALQQVLNDKSLLTDGCVPDVA
jgi:hypothetical protein